MNLQQLADRISRLESDLQQLRNMLHKKPADPTPPVVERRKPGPKPKVQQ